jgi:hypothetical protein
MAHRKKYSPQRIEADRLMKRIMGLYAYMDQTMMRSQFYLAVQELTTVEHDFAMLGYMPREDAREVLVRVPEYRSLNKKLEARS